MESLIKIATRLSVAIPVAILIFSCSGRGSKDTTNSSVSLDNVRQLIVAPTGLVNSSIARTESFFRDAFLSTTTIFESPLKTMQSNQIYKVDPLGNITVVKIADLVSGASNSTASSGLIINSSKFVFFTFNDLYQPISGGGGSRQCALVGVRKSDGKLTCIASGPRCDASNPCNVDVYKSQVKINGDGDMLFLVLGDGGLNRIDLKDPDNPVESSIFTHTNLGDASVPIVNSSNDVMVAINLGSSATNVVTKIFGTNGQTFDVPGSTEVNRITCSFAGSGNTATSFYYVYFDTASSQFRYIQLSRNTDGTFTPSTLYTESTGGVLGANCTNVVHNGNRIFGLNWYNLENPSFPGNSVLMDYPTSAGSITHHTLDATFPIKTDLHSYAGGLAILGTSTDGATSGIERFDTATNTATTILPAGQFSVTSMSVSSSGDISFVGVRLADSVNILGQLSLATNDLSNSNLTVRPVAIVSLK